MPVDEGLTEPRAFESIASHAGQVETPVTGQVEKPITGQVETPITGLPTTEEIIWTDYQKRLNSLHSSRHQLYKK